MILFYQTKNQNIKFYEKYKHLITYAEYNYDSDNSSESSDEQSNVSSKNKSENIFNLMNETMNESITKP